jgi:hypothetical protein
VASASDFEESTWALYCVCVLLLARSAVCVCFITAGPITNSHAQRLGGVESGTTSKRRLQAQGIRTGRESRLPRKGEEKEKRTRDGGNTETKDETENDAPEDEVEGGGRACRQKGWWKRGDVEAKLNTVNMTAWVHKECNGIEEEAITKLQEAWDSSEQKDECTLRLNDLEGANWMGTEIGQLGGYGFQGVTLGVDGSCKDGKMGSGCCKFGEKDEGKCARVGREDEGVSSNRPELGAVVLALQSVGLNEDALLLCDNEESCASSENGWDREEKRR